MSEEISSSVKRLIDFFDANKIDYMLIGGYALSYYGRIRATLDVDVAVAIETSTELESFCNKAKKASFTPHLATIRTPVFILLDKDSGLEFEIWTRPDGIEWDNEILKRRRRERFHDFLVWIISPEDLIVNKLARPDRGAVDEQDVKSILIRIQDKLDWKYLENRAKKMGVYAVLTLIKEA